MICSAQVPSFGSRGKTATTLRQVLQETWVTTKRDQADLPYLKHSQKGLHGNPTFKPGAVRAGADTSWNNSATYSQQKQHQSIQQTQLADGGTTEIFQPRDLVTRHSKLHLAEPQRVLKSQTDVLDHMSNTWAQEGLSGYPREYWHPTTVSQPDFGAFVNTETRTDNLHGRNMVTKHHKVALYNNNPLYIRHDML